MRSDKPEYCLRGFGRGRSPRPRRTPSVSEDDLLVEVERLDGLCRSNGAEVDRQPRP